MLPLPLVNYVSSCQLVVCAHHGCAVSPITGKSSGQEVLVQGKQAQVVTELLLGKGVPKKWVEVHDLSDGKKK